MSARVVQAWAPRLPPLLRTTTIKVPRTYRQLMWCRMGAATLSCHHLRSFHATQSPLLVKADNGQKARWLFPAGSFVEFMEDAHQHGVSKMGFSITINCSTPLDEQQIQQVLMTLQQKMPNLRACLRPRQGKLWMAELQNPALDFKVFRGDLTTLEEEIMGPTYNSAEGPLWRSRLRLCDRTEPCLVPHLKVTHPHQYDIAAGFHHAIGDGLTGLAMIINLLKVLEAVANNEDIDDSQFGELVTGEHTDQLLADIEAQLKKDPQATKDELVTHSKRKFTPLLNQVFGTPQDPQRSTGYIDGLIDSAIILEFKSKCTDASVSVNSGVAAAVSLALAEEVREAGLQLDSYPVTSRHPVDLRRYWQGHPLKSFGCHASFILHTTQVPLGRDRIWELAHQYNSEVREKIKGAMPLRDKVLRKWFHPETCNGNSYYSTLPPVNCDYVLSLMYSPAFANFGVGKTVEVTRMNYCHTMQRSEIPILLTCADFRGSMHLYMMHSDQRMSSSTAHNFFNRILDVITHMARN